MASYDDIDLGSEVGQQGEPAAEPAAEASRGDAGEPAAEAAPAEGAAPAAPQAVWNGDEWVLTWRGSKFVPKSRDQLVSLAQQGLSYQASSSKIKQAQEEARRQAEQYKQYAELDKAFQTNPEFQKAFWDWHHQYLNNGGKKNEAPDELQAIVQKTVAPLAEKLSTIEAQRQQEEVSRADKALREEVDALQKKYPDAGWDHTDGEATTLQRVMRFAMDHGGLELEAAYKLLYHDQIVQNEKAKALRESQNQREKSRREGVVDIASTGTRPKAAEKRPQSYNEALEMALADAQGKT